MCDGNRVIGAGLIGGGAGLILGILLPGSFWLFLLGAALIAAGIFLLNL